MYNEIRWRNFLLMFTLPALLGGCDVFLPFRAALCGSGLVQPAPQPSYEQDPDDPCLRRLTSDPAELPTYAQALAESECEALRTESCFSFSGEAWRTGICNGGELLFISFSGGFGGPTMYFDSQTQRLVGVTHTSDALDLTCAGVTYDIAKIDCNDRVVTRLLCPFGPFTHLLP